MNDGNNSTPLTRSFPALGGRGFLVGCKTYSVFSDVINSSLQIIKNPAFAGSLDCTSPSFRYNTPKYSNVIKYDLHHFINTKITHIDKLEGNQLNSAYE
ncbi:hypothetical protein MNL09_04040 [Bartonella krasnovii]|nr:hypothetical protein MNL09_04040 [Bartonella krasnovii]